MVQLSEVIAEIKSQHQGKEKKKHRPIFVQMLVLILKRIDILQFLSFPEGRRKR